MKSSEILIKYRKNNRLTVSKFAEMLGVSQVFLTLLEHDKRKISDDLFERLKEFLSIEEITMLKESEKYKSIPNEIAKKIGELEEENRKLKEKYSQIDERVLTLDKKSFSQYEKTMNEASLFFQDETISEEDKQKMVMAISELFFESKQMNKEKYKKNKKDDNE